ncbi:MAG TPA: RNB domain-containing ribonuclease, partial [Ottowia sp.]|nr:RNB domain-containing ribonuclease [Ottowia sp.]
MNNNLHPHQKEELAELAVIAMRERGLAPAFGPAVRQQLERIDGPAEDDGPDIIDLTGLPWCSIDNDDSRDLDQLTVSQTLPDGSVKILVAIADVDALVAKDTPIDRHAQINTTSVYTSARIFPMLPEKLSTDLTSLNPHQVRVATVTEMVF